MTRQTSSSCLCRIPVHEAAIPSFLMSTDLAEWAEQHKVEIAPDHLGRPSVDVATAYRLRDEADEAAERSERQRARAQQVEQERLAGLVAQRQQTYEQELFSAAARGVGSAAAAQAARDAVDRVEANVDAATRSQLGPVWIDDGRLASALIVGLQVQNDAQNAANAAAI